MLLEIISVGNIRVNYHLIIDGAILLLTRSYKSEKFYYNFQRTTYIPLEIVPTIGARLIFIKHGRINRPTYAAHGRRGRNKEPVKKKMQMHIRRARGRIYKKPESRTKKLQSLIAPGHFSLLRLARIATVPVHTKGRERESNAR